MEDEDVEQYWSTFKNVVVETCQQVLGPKTSDHKDWISSDTLLKIKERKKQKETLLNSKTRAAKETANQNYNQACKEVKRSAVQDKQSYIDNIADKAEEAAQKGNLRDVYQYTKRLSGNYKTANRPVKRQQGKPLSTIE
jgi:hypothetical protein